MTINCKGKLIDLTSPKVMGILNITPDSFYKGSRYHSDSDALKTAESMLQDGATFLDIGGYSSRPGAEHVSESEELQRVLPIIESILKRFPEALISVDTFRSQIAKESIEAGAALINDISAGQLDPQMLETVGGLKTPYMMMHMRGNPQTMQSLTEYNDILVDITTFFSERIQLAKHFGILDIIVDPGFGFSKSLEQNYTLLNSLDHFKILDKPILIGVSRKSMIYKLLNTDAEHAKNGTTALNMVALQHGASILRVHDVKEAMECVALHKQLNH